jgi:hypothetical protein
VAFIARQTLDELNLSGATVEAVLAHSTNRSPQAQELAAVNSFAALAELNHFERAGVGFQGDPSCGLKARSGKGLGTTYVVQLGTELSADEYHAACDRLAEFLFVDAATPAGGWLRACRGADPQQTPDETGCRVRSFGIRQIGVGHDPLIDKAATRLSRSVLERWLGQPRAVSATKSTRVLPIPTPGRTSVQDSQAAKDAQLDTIAATHAATLGFDLDRMMHLAQQLATKILDGNPDQCFRSIPLAFPVTSDGPPLDRWLSSVTELFGTRFGAEGPAKVSALQTDLDDQARAAAGPIGLAARQWIESLVDHPSARMYGAQRVAKWLQGHLKGLLERVRETRMRLNHEWFAVEQQLIATVRPDPRQKGKAAQPADVLLLQLCRLRLLELVAAGAGTLVSTLQAHLLQAQDGLTDLSRELQNLTNHYSTPDVEEPIDIEDPLASMKASVADKLRSQEEQLAAKLDDVLTTGLVTPSGGLRKLLHSAEQLNAFRQQLETIARSTILRSLEQLDLAGLVLNSSGSMSGDEFSKLLAAAQPALQACGGERRLACIVPTTSAVTDADVAKTLAAEPRVFAETPTIVRDAGSDVVLLFEIGEIPLVQVAAAFIDQRPDYLECAERIHTRADVQWQPLLRF